MAETHIFKAGETIEGICQEHGFADWRAVYDHAGNAKLRGNRPEPKLLQTGDRIFIPDKIEKRESAGTDQAHTYRVAAPPKGKNYLRNVTILVHGVNTTAGWFDLVVKEMDKYQDQCWVDDAKVEHNIRYGVIPFSWGDYTSQKQGGLPNYAVDEVHQMFRNSFVGYDRIYQGHAAVRLKELIDDVNELGVQINLFCHSNGTAVISGALMLGATVDNVAFMGSPLDCDNDRSNDEIKAAQDHINGTLTNFWSAGDEWAWIKGGIGAFGNNKTFRKKNPNIKGVKFYKGAVIEGLKITEGEVDHSDYMLARHMPIFSAYIRRWAEECGDPSIEYDQAKIDEFLATADWTNVSYYTSKKNVTLKSPELKKYEAEIKGILEG